MERENVREITNTQNILDVTPVYYEFVDKSISSETQAGFPPNTPEVLPHLLLATKHLRDNCNSNLVFGEGTIHVRDFKLYDGNLHGKPLMLDENGFKPAQTQSQPQSALLKILSLQAGLPPNQVHSVLPQVTYQIGETKYINYHELMVHVVEAIKDLYKLI
jgi:hypothetical protein